MTFLLESHQIGLQSIYLLFQHQDLPFLLEDSPSSLIPLLSSLYELHLKLIALLYDVAVAGSLESRRILLDIVHFQI